MVGLLSSSSVLSLLILSAEAAKEHGHLHNEFKRGYPMSSPAAASYPVSSPSPATYPISTAPAYSNGTYSAKTYPHTSTETLTSTVYSTLTVVPVESTPAAGASSYPVAESSYPVAESSYPVAESSYPAAASSYPAAKSGHSHGHGHSTAPAAETSYCAAVTVTVTAGSAPSVASKKSKTKPAATSTYEVSSPVAATSTYVASSPAVSTYAAATPSSSSSSSSSGATGKRGMAFANVGSLNIEASSFPWAMNWAATGSVPSGVEYVPALNTLEQASAFAEAASSASYLLACNEPDESAANGGSQLTPSEAAQAYQTYLMPHAGSAKLGSISVTSDNNPSGNLNGLGSPSGLAYLQEFYESCSSCHFDFVQLHWYGAAGQSGAEQASAFQSYITEAISFVEQVFGEGVPIWITEVSPLPTIDQDTSGVNEEFMKIAIPWLDQQPNVERYAYYAAMPNLLVDSSGDLTQIGQLYASL